MWKDVQVDRRRKGPALVCRLSEIGGTLLKRTQGKGWGSSSVRRETGAAWALLSQKSVKSVVCLDIGANVGDWTAALLDHPFESRVYAFEPNSAAFANLRSRFSLQDNVETIQLAVGRANGHAKLWFDQDASKLASLSRRRLDHLNLSFDNFETVPVTRLDSWALANKVQPSLIKLDIEGHELDALEGAGILMESVEVVQFEFGGCNIDTRTYFQDFFYFFRDHGFGLLRLTPFGLLPVDTYSETDEIFQTTNYFAYRV